MAITASPPGAVADTAGAKRPYAAVTALTAAAFAVLWFTFRPWAFPLDDAYITAHNAQVLLTGRDASFGAPALLGASSPAHLLLVAGAQLVWPPILAQFVVGALGAVAYLTALVAMARQAKLGALAGGAVVIAGAFTGSAAYHLVNGLETGWAMAIVAWAIVLAQRPPSRALALLCGLMPFVRPELGLLSGVLLLRQAWIRGRDWKSTALDFALAAAVAAPFVAWTWMTLGAILPNTIAAKRAFFANDWPLRESLLIEATAAISAMGFGALLALAAPRSTLKLVLLAFVGLFLLGFAIALPPALGWNDQRYAMPLLPVAIWGLCQAAPRPMVFHVGAGICLALALVSSSAMVATFERGERMSQDAMQAGRWLSENAAAQDAILVHDDGAVAMTARHRLIDMVGLKSNLPAGATSADRISSLAVHANARWAVILHDKLGFWSKIAADLRARGWTLALTRPRGFATGYDVYRLTPPQ